MASNNLSLASSATILAATILAIVVVRRVALALRWVDSAAAQACGIDHLVMIFTRLEDGMDAIERLTGVRPAYGGHHPGLGTHNVM